MSHNVLRSIFLSREEDEAIRLVAAQMNMSKADLIRLAIEQWLPVARQQLIHDRRVVASKGDAE